jgi:hypothetical protein
MAAVVTTVGRAARYAVMLGHPVAFLAKDAIRIEVTLEPLEAGRIVRKLAVEVSRSVLTHFRLAIQGVRHCKVIR